MISLIWIGFVLFVIGMLALDLCVLHRKAHVIGAKEALGWTVLWIAVAMAFNVVVYFLYEYHLLGIGHHVEHDTNGQNAALEFFAGYLMEKSLSLDNIFVISLIFNYFQIPLKYQHRVLFWGILGALVLRGVMIAAGVVLIKNFWWITYAFGGLLILTAMKLMVSSDEQIDPDRNILVRIARRFYPVSKHLDGENFFTRIDDAGAPIIGKGADGAGLTPSVIGRFAMTPMFLVLLVVESTDVLFAVDSIPAVFAITQDPFLVFTSNVFAILGLRSLYFALAILVENCKYLKPSLVFLLAYIGVKMLLQHHYPIPIGFSLAVMLAILGTGIGASLVAMRRGRHARVAETVAFDEGEREVAPTPIPE